MARRWRSPDRIGIAVLVVFVIAVTIWVITNSSSDGHEPSDQLETAVAHVHALGVNPADSTLLAATHYGLYRIDAEGVATRVSDSFQDTMGFTVVGPDHFLGSGHPDLPGRRAGQPTLLGLIESTDGGASWVNLSLAGEADFHGLSFLDGTTYGWDATSGTFMVSTDRSSWERRSTVEMFAFVVDRSDESRVVAAGPDGIIRSSDGGRSWSAATGPLLVALTSRADGSLWGADSTGTVWSTDDGSNWSRAGRVEGEPNALLASENSVWVATRGDDMTTTIRRSDDNGDSWSVAYQEKSALTS